MMGNVGDRGGGRYGRGDAIKGQAGLVVHGLHLRTVREVAGVAGVVGLRG